jgi:phage host-nuclease inhibitor protein Gam
VRLFEIAGEYKALQDILENDLEFDEETGEITDNSAVIQELFNELALTLSSKLDNSAYVVLNLRTASDALKEEAKRLNDRAKHFANNAEKLESMMANALQSSGEMKLKTDRFTFSFRKSEQVEIADLLSIDDFDERFVRVKKELDRVNLKKALKSGEAIKGVEIVEKQNFQIK